MMGPWGLARGVRMKKLEGDIFFLQFAHIVDRRKVMNNVPWAFKRNLVILRPIGENESPNRVNLDVCDFMVHVSDLPLTPNPKKVARVIANHIGTYVNFDDQAYKGMFTDTLHVRVCLDITKPLRRWVTVEGPDGKPRTLNITYEKLAPKFLLLLWDTWTPSEGLSGLHCFSGRR